MPTIKFLFLVIIIQLISFKGETPKWKLIKNENGIKVYISPILGTDATEIKIITSFKSSLSELAIVMRDVASFPKWISKCEKTKVLKFVNDSVLYYYNETYAPWSFANRYLVVKQEITYPKRNVLIVKANAAEGLMKPKDHLVKITEMNASWVFISEKNGFISLTYRIKSNPQVNIPSSIANKLLRTGAYNTILNLKKLMNKKE